MEKQFSMTAGITVSAIIIIMSLFSFFGCATVHDHKKLHEPMKPLAYKGIWVYKDGLAYVITKDSKFRVIDLSNPSAPVEVGACSADFVWRQTRFFQIKGSFAYLFFREDPSALLMTPGTFSWYIIDVSDPKAPKPVRAVSTPFDDVLGLMAVGSRAYILANINRYAPSYSWYIFDLSNPDYPLRVGEFPGRQYGNLSVSGDLVYTELRDVWSNSLVVFDVSNPAAPVETARIALPGDNCVVEVESDLGYVFCEGEMWVIDVSDPWAPVKLGELKSDSLLYPSHIEIVEGLIYRAGLGLGIVDVSNLAAPVELGRIRHHSNFYLKVLGDLVYMIGRGTFNVIDVSDPTTPVNLSELKLYTGGLWVTDGVAYVFGVKGLYVIDVSDPAAPVQLSLHPSSVADLTRKHGADATPLDSARSNRSDSVIDLLEPPNQQRASPVNSQQQPLPVKDAEATEAGTLEAAVSAEVQTVMVNIEYKAGFAADFPVAFSIDDGAEMILGPNTRIVKKLTKKRHTIKVSDPRKGLLSQPNWSDYEIVLDLERNPDAEVIVHGRNIFVGFRLEIIVVCGGEEISKHKIVLK